MPASVDDPGCGVRQAGCLEGCLGRFWRPYEDPDSPILMDPEVRFGRPAIKGISTVVLWEQVEAGADFDEVAGLIDLSTDDVEWAWAYERKQPGVRAARSRRRSASTSTRASWPGEDGLRAEG